MTPMTPDEIQSFLNGPHIAHIAVLRRDGSPHVTPVWYEYNGHNILAIAEETTLKVRCVKREPRVSVSIATSDVPYRYVQITGFADVSDSGAEEALRSMSLRYKGPDLGPPYVDRILETKGHFVLITIRPDRVIGWTED